MAKISRKKGFVILYAVLVAGVVSIGGILLANIIVKQLMLSSFGRESQFAYYAADSGDECARQGYTHGAFGVFNEGFDGEPEYLAGELGLLTCEQGDIIEGDDGEFKKFTFNVQLVDSEDSPSCARTTIWIHNNANSSYTIESTGLNYCADHPRQVEKVIFRSDTTDN
ncbi:MAG: hypothetical protein AAB821_02390 [Patescibacteria group bacterium]